MTNIPGGNSRGTQRPDLVPGVDPVPEGRRALAEPGGVRDAAAGHVRQPAAQLPARTRLLAGGPDAQQGLPVRATQGLQLRVEIFNIANRLNYENPAATLPNGTPGAPFTDAQAGTFGYMLRVFHRAVENSLHKRCICATSVLNPSKQDDARQPLFHLHQHAGFPCGRADPRCAEAPKVSLGTVEVLLTTAPTLSKSIRVSMISEAGAISRRCRVILEWLPSTTIQTVASNRLRVLIVQGLVALDPAIEPAPSAGLVPPSSGHPVVDLHRGGEAPGVERAGQSGRRTGCY